MPLGRSLVRAAPGWNHVPYYEIYGDARGLNLWDRRLRVRPGSPVDSGWCMGNKEMAGVWDEGSLSIRFIVCVSRTDLLKGIWRPMTYSMEFSTGDPAC